MVGSTFILSRKLPCPRSTSSPKSTRSKCATPSTRPTRKSRPASTSRAPTPASSPRRGALTLYADDDFKLSQVTDILTGKLTKRGVDIRALKYGDVQKVSGNKVKQVVTVRVGVEQELSKKIVKLIKDSKMKVQASIQGDAVRVSGAKRDDLQDAIALVKKSITDFPVQFNNFRD